MDKQARNAYMRAWSRRPGVREKLAVRDKRWRKSARQSGLVDLPQLLALLTYDAQTGLFYWRKKRGGSRPDGSAGAYQKDNRYIRININGRLYAAHRLAWFHVHGEWPPQDIDHVNGNRADNRIANLRLCSRAENLLNSCRRRDNRSGVKGVSWDKGTKKWHARIKRNGKVFRLGYFSDLSKAAEAYARAAEELHGPFARPDSSI